MITLNYKQIFNESLKIYNKNFLPLTFISTILCLLPITYGIISFQTKNNKTIFYILSSLVLLIMFFIVYILFKGAVNSVFTKCSFNIFKVNIIHFSRFIVSGFLSFISSLVVAFPSILAFIILLIAFNAAIRPYNKEIFNFDDFRRVFSILYLYFYGFLVTFLINLPFMLYGFLKTGFTPFYSIQKNCGPIESLKTNLEDTVNVDKISAIITLFFICLFDFISICIIIYIANLFIYGTINNNYVNLLLIFIPIILLPFLAVQLGYVYKKINQKTLIA
jgi:hypothetical protein